jgi:hypothetical protein
VLPGDRSFCTTYSFPSIAASSSPTSLPAPTGRAGASGPWFSPVLFIAAGLQPSRLVLGDSFLDRDNRHGFTSQSQSWRKVVSLYDRNVVRIYPLAFRILTRTLRKEDHGVKKVSTKNFFSEISMKYKVNKCQQKASEMVKRGIEPWVVADSKLACWIPREFCRMIA